MSFLSLYGDNVFIDLDTSSYSPTELWRQRKREEKSEKGKLENGEKGNRENHLYQNKYIVFGMDTI